MVRQAPNADFGGPHFDMSERICSTLNINNQIKGDMVTCIHLAEVRGLTFQSWCAPPRRPQQHGAGK